MNRLIASAIDQASRLGTPACAVSRRQRLPHRPRRRRTPDRRRGAGRPSAPRRRASTSRTTAAWSPRSSRPLRARASMDPEANRLFDGGARMLTLRSFLTTNAIRSTHAMNGVDWCSSNNSTPVRGRADRRAGAGRRDGRQHRPPRQRNALRDGRQPRQGLRRGRRARTTTSSPAPSARRERISTATPRATSSTTWPAGSTRGSSRWAAGR